LYKFIFKYHSGKIYTLLNFIILYIFDTNIVFDYCIKEFIIRKILIVPPGSNLNQQSIYVYYVDKNYIINFFNVFLFIFLIKGKIGYIIPLHIFFIYYMEWAATRYIKVDIS
jgi:hypothetical protein